MKLRSDEWLKLTPLIDRGEDVLDIRVWRKTPTGGIPTRNSLIISERMVIPLIMTLQKLHRMQSEKKANTTEASRG